MMKKRASLLAWLALILPLLYLALPLVGTFIFSLQQTKGTLSLTAYNNALGAPDFAERFLFSVRAAVLTVVFSIALIVPTAFWVNLKLPRARPFVEFFTLLPFVVPSVVLVFGLIRAHNSTGLTNSANGVYVLLVGAYITFSFPYMFRAVDTGLRTINVRTLTEAAQSLGAGWFTVILRVILPNILVAVLNGSFITFAIVITEYTVASLLSQPGFGPYLQAVSSRKVYEPSALTIVTLLLTWLCVALIQLIGRGSAQSRMKNFY
jgi:putative spermidine/putrescine transport system permease protein